MERSGSPTKSGPVAIFVGSTSAPNVKREISNLGKMLAGSYQLHLITTSPEGLGQERLSYYEVFGDECDPTIFGGFNALYSYMNNNDPRVIFQITRPPIHGLIVGSISKMFSVYSVYRYSGDRFHQYKTVPHKGKPISIFRNNIIGLISMHLADRHIALGENGKKRMQNRGINKDSIMIIPPAIDNSRFEISDDNNPNFEFPSHRKIVMFIGRLVPIKGVATLEASIPKVISQRDDIQFVLVGENSHFEIPGGYEEYVTLTGYIPPSDIPDYLTSADVLVHPALKEGFGRVVIESLTAGTPVIARDIGELGSVTENTFTKDSEFVEMICNLESLPLDDASRFSLDTVGSKYRHLINNLDNICS
jgi:glycosyltransferase involved in cell wall biosynthesis